MTWSLVDLEGATVDHFTDREQARIETAELIEATPDLADQLFLVEYSQGQRVGTPLLLSELVS